MTVSHDPYQRQLERQRELDALHFTHAVRAGLPPRFPAQDTVSQARFAPPSGHGSGVMWQRVVSSDPRELWYLALPSKLLPRQVEQIKRAGLGGDLWQQWQLQALIEDSWPMFKKCAHEVRQAVASVRFVVRAKSEEGEEPSKKSQEKARLVRESLTCMRPDRFTDECGFATMVYHLTDAMLNGVSMIEIHWDKRTKLPRAASWVHPRHYTFRQDGKMTIMGDADTTLNLSLPPKGIGLNEDQLAMKFLCAQFISRSGSSLGGGLIRPLGTWWSYWIYAREWIATMAQKHGTPFLKAKYTNGAMTQDEQDRLESKLRDAGANNYLLMPSTADVEVIPAQSLGTDNPIMHLVRMADEAPQILLLGQTATTQGTPGKLGGEQEHGMVKRENVEALAGWVGRVLTDQWAVNVIKANYGDDSDCPTIEADFTETTKPAEQAARYVQLCNPNMPPILLSEFYKDNSLTQPKPGDEVVHGGKATIYEGAQTKEEMFEEDLNHQVMQAEAAAELQGGDGVQASERPVPIVVKAIKSATNEELDDLIELGDAVIRGDRNGKLDQLKVKLDGLSRRK